MTDRKIKKDGISKAGRQGHGARGIIGPRAEIRVAIDVSNPERRGWLNLKDVFLVGIALDVGRVVLPFIRVVPIQMVAFGGAVVGREIHPPC